jgi:hypothetical protein
MSITRWSIDGGRIQVETVIRAPLSDVLLWTLTPELHARWDDRFSSIRLLPGAQPAGAGTAFEYSRRLIPGLVLRGWGTTRATRHERAGTAISTLRFGSDSPLSPIRVGAGFWRFVEGPDGVRFSTGYDYETRWGAVGRAFDRVVFRRAMGWATGRSFERLRTWLEGGVEP